MTTARRCVLAFVLTLAAAIPILPQSPKQEEIPFQFSRSFGLMLVRAEVNGKPAVLVLDTGSNHTTISSRFVDVATPSLKETVSGEKGSGYAGVGVFTKASLRLGHVVWHDHRILAMDMEGISKSLGEKIDGLLGMDFLNECGMVTVDVRQHKLILR